MNVIREQYEWTNNWWSNANDPTLPRVLLIGDSISCGYSPVVTELLKGQVHVDRMANSKVVSDPAHFKETAYFLGEYEYEVIHFNNGLHGFHASDDVYRDALNRYVDLIEEKRNGARLIWASSTPVTAVDDTQTPHSEKNPIVLRRNAIAAQIMSDHQIPINDLYSLVFGQADIRVPDGYHYNEKGYQLTGQAVADCVQRELNGKK